MNQVQLLPRQIVAGCSVLDDLIDLGDRPCEVIFGLLGQRRERFIHLADLIGSRVIPLHFAANLLRRQGDLGNSLAGRVQCFVLRRVYHQPQRLIARNVHGIQLGNEGFSREQTGHIDVGGGNRTHQRLVRKDGRNVEFAGSNGFFDELAARNGIITDVRIADALFLRGHRTVLSDGQRVEAAVCTLDDKFAYRQRSHIRLGHGEVGHIQLAVHALFDNGCARRQILDLRPVDVCRFDTGIYKRRNVRLKLRDTCPVDLRVIDIRRSQLRQRDFRHSGVQVFDGRPVNRRTFDVCGGDLRLGDLCNFGVQVGDAGPVDIGIVDIGGRDLRLRNGRNLGGQLADVCPVDVGLFNIGGGNLRHGDGGQRGIEFIRGDVLRGQLLYFRRDRRDGRGVQFANGGLSDFGLCDGRVLNVCGLNRRHLHLQAAHRPRLQLSRAHRIDGQLAAGNHAGGQLAGRDHAAFQRIGHGAQCYGSIFARQAVIGVLRHAHGHFHADAPGHHAHTVAEENVGKRGVLPVLLRIRAVDEIYLQCDRRQITALGVFILRSLAHFDIALRLAFWLVAVRDFPGFRYRQMNPFRMGISIQIRTVDVELRQIQDVPVSVLAGGHDAGNHVCFVHIVGNAGQVFLFPDGYIGVVAHAPDQKHIVPVAGQLCAVLLHQSAFAQQGFHGIDVFPLHVLSS